MKNQQKKSTTNTQKRKRNDEVGGKEYDYEDDARLLRELKRRRATLEEELNTYKKLVESMSKGITEIGQKLKEGTIRPERLEFKKRVYNDFVRFLPEARENFVKSKLEFDTCCSLIVEIESSLEGQRRVSDSNSNCTATAAVAVATEAE